LAGTAIASDGISCTAADVRIGDYVFINGAFTTGDGNLLGYTTVTTNFGYMWYKVSSIITGTGGTSQSVVGSVTKFGVSFLTGGTVTYTAGITTNSRIRAIQ
jgi:hypothetical protein